MPTVRANIAYAYREFERDHGASARRIAKRVALMLLIALVLEVFVFNINFYASSGYNSVNVNDRLELRERVQASLDRLMKERNYSNRSEVFRDILRDIIAKEDLTRGDAEALAVVSYSFNHHKRQLTERMNEIQHANIGLVVTAMHVHVSHEVCSETIILRGPVSEIQSLALDCLSARCPLRQDQSDSGSAG